MAKQWETEGPSSTHFHSSRKERHISGGIKEKKKSLSFFKRNPSMKIILLDLVFIVIISGVIVPFIMKREGTSSIDNYKISLKAFSFDDEVMATLTISETKNIETTGLVEADFYFEKDSVLANESDLLPSISGERVIRTKMNWDNSEYLFCHIGINDKSKIIKVRIR